MSVSISGAGSISGLDQGFNVTTGSVAIGTDNPGAKLEVHSDTIPRINTVFQGSKHFGMSVGGSGGGFVLTDGHFMTVNHQPYADRGTDNNLTERLRIQSNGNTGIGTNNPGSNKLQVQGSSAFYGNGGASATWGDTSYLGALSFDGSAQPVIRAASSKALIFQVNQSTEALRIASDGKIGVNDTSPASLFTVNNGTNDDHCFLIKNDNVGAYFGTYGTGHGSYPREVTINATRIDSGSSPFLRIGGQGGIKFCVDFNTERLRIQPSGYVGIGEDAPGGKLTVKHANTATSGLNATLKLKQGVATNGNRSSLIFSSLDDFDVAAVNGVVEVHSGTSANNVGRLEFWTKASGSDAAERLRISSDGKVCVGTTLTNYGVLQIRDASGDSTTSAIQVENASSGSNTTNVISRSVSLNSGAWANAEYRAKSHIFSYQTTPIATIQQHGLTIASQPCFWATSNTGGSHTNTGTTGIISNQFEAAYVNVGNHFNTSNGVFTCPVAGVYEFHGQGLARQQGSDNNMELTFYKNGSNTMSRSYGYTYVKGSNDHDNLHVMGYITCAANDQIDLRVHDLGSGVDCYFAQGLGYFAGRLVQ